VAPLPANAAPVPDASVPAANAGADIRSRDNQRGRDRESR
jgi:hypothetical protein